MSSTKLPSTLVIVAFLSAPLSVSAQARSTHQQLARDIFKELIEINTTDSVGNTTAAAEAMAKRLKDTGFPAADVQVLGPTRAKATSLRGCVARARASRSCCSLISM